MARIDTLEPTTQTLARQLLERAASEGIDARISDALRSCERQNQIWQQGRDAEGNIVDKTKVATRARGCRSWHVFGRAFDVLVYRDGAIVHDGTDPSYLRLGEIGTELGLYWGGNFKDWGHFEYHPGVTTEQACPDPSQCEYYASRYPHGPEPVPPPPKASARAGWVSPALWVAALGALGAFAWWQSRQGLWWKQLQAEGRKSPLVREGRIGL